MVMKDSYSERKQDNNAPDLPPKTYKTFYHYIKYRWQMLGRIDKPFVAFCDDGSYFVGPHPHFIKRVIDKDGNPINFQQSAMYVDALTWGNE